MIHIANPSKPSGGGKRVARFTVGTSTVGWTAADCDYLCDGADDQVEINAAIQALPATGGEVVILDGTYNITAKIAVDKANTKLSGNGAATTLKRQWDSSNLTNAGVVWVSAANCIVARLRIDGNKTAYVGTYHNNGIILYRTSGCIVTENIIVSCAECGISLWDSSRSVISNNIVSGCMDYGIYSSQLFCDAIIGNMCNENGVGIGISGSHSTIVGNCCIGNDCGIKLESASRNLISSNIALRISSSGYTNIQFTIKLAGTSNNGNLISCNQIFGKDYSSDGGTGNTFINNKYN